MQPDYLVIKLLILILIAALLSVKTIYFLKIPGRKTLNHWIHYNIYQLVNSKTHQIESAKKAQNKFTVLISIAVFAGALIMFLFR